MKNSGIEWIGDIPVGWEIVRIGTQYTERKKKVSDTEYPPLSVTMKGIVPQLATAAKTDAHDDRKLVCIGDFAINSRSDRRGSCGISAYDGSVSLINTILCPRDKMNPNYYGWLFRSTMFSDEFYKWGHGIVNDLWTTNWQDMKKIFIPEPSLVEQQKIASFLDQKCAEIDVVIEKTKATIEEYKKLKQSVITEAVTKGIRGNRPMKDSGIEWIGEIPVGWEICKIKNKFSVYSGATPKSEHPEFWDGDILWITPADYKTTEKYITSGKRTISEEGYNSCGTTLVPENSIIFSKRAPIGSVAISRNELCTNQGCLSCVTKGEVNILFYYYVMSSFTEIFELFGSGTTFKEISFDTFSSFYIPNPDLKEQKEIADYLDQKCAEIDTLIAKKTTLLTELETYKKSLIYEYVTGKKEVREDTASTQVAVYSPYFPVIIKVNNLYNALKTFMFGILDKCNYDTGRVKLEKMMFVAQHSIGCDLGNEYSRAELGPLDSLFYQCEYDLVKDGCIIKNKKRNIRRIYYKPGRNNHKYKEEYNRYFADCDTEIDRIINIFKDYDVQKSERIATLFGAWNDAIIDKRQFTDEDIVEDVLNNWHEHKGDYSKEEWLEDLEEMKKINLIPKGYGKKTVIKND